MSAIRRILVAVKDPAARSTPALAKAAQLARALDARLLLFHALVDPVYIDAPDVQALSLPRFESDRRSAVVRRLEGAAARLARHGVRVSTAVEWDFPAHEAILRQAERFGADLIVAEAHPTRHTASWLLRFTDWELMRQSAVPVLLVKTAKPYRRPRVLAAVDPTHAFAKPAKLDAEILRCAGALSEALRGTLHAVHAFNPLPVGIDAAEWSGPDNLQALTDAIAARARASVDHELRSTKIPPDRRHVLGRHPSDAISAVVREIDCGLLVMGAISRSGLKRLVLGDTAERILDAVKSDVLVVKPRHFRVRVARRPRGARVIAWPTLVPVP
jgi:universal stress protein E